MRDKETYTNEAMTTTDSRAKRKSPTRTDNEEEVSQAMKVAKALDPTLYQSETRHDMNETAAEEMQDKKPRTVCVNARIGPPMHDFKPSSRNPNHQNHQMAV